MRNKAQLLTTIGLLLLVIGASFLVGTIYRSTYNPGGQLGAGKGSDSSAFNGPLSLSPRNYVIELDLTYYDEILHLEPISSVEFYLLDSKGSELWLSKGIIDPVWSAKEVSPTGTLSMEIPHRGDYYILLINPDNSNISGYLHPKMYGYESDLLWFSVTTLVVGLVITVASKIMFQNKTKQPSTVAELKKADYSSSGTVLLSQNVVSNVPSAKGVGASRVGGQLRRLLVWELEESFAFPMLEVILVIAVLTVLTPAIIEVSPAFSYVNLTSGIQPIFLFLIFIAGVLFCHSYAGSISKGETKMVLSYPVQRSKLFLAKFIALFTVLSIVYIGVFALQIPLLALNPFEPMFYASLLLVILQLFLVCTMSTFLSVVTKNEVLSILASALLFFGIESVASSESLVTFTGRFTTGFTFIRQYVHGGLSSTPLIDGLFSVFVVGGISVLLLVFSYVYFTRKMEID
ncbi:MAG: ABC transporter permease [Candidatus Bathyarchaeia archaeon]|jgi:ABC-type transport system involved in multi-copper enzyme maturation permease subunit